MGRCAIVASLCVLGASARTIFPWTYAPRNTPCTASRNFITGTGFDT